MEGSQAMEQGATKDERKWAMLSHVLSFSGLVFPFGNILAPLIVWLLKREGLPLVDDQGKESLNFQISFTIYAVLSSFLVLILIGYVLLTILGLVWMVLVIIATIRANNGERYRYPLTIRLIK